MNIRPREECRYDLVALCEVMLRLDPGDVRISTTRSFRALEGGGEYNVARGLRRCFGARTGIVTALADNPVGRLIEDLMLQGGVDSAQLVWRVYDGVGREVRNGLNFTERGFGVRGAVGCSDRGHSAASQLKPGDVDWDHVFGIDGARWFHTGGVFCALSETSALLAIEGVEAARRYGTVVSYDLNYRPSLWKAHGGTGAAAAVNRQVVEHGPQPSTTGRPSAGAARASTSARASTASRSSTGSAAGTRSPRASFTGCSTARMSTARSRTASPTARSR